MRKIVNRPKTTKRYPCLYYTDQVVYLVQTNVKGDKFTLFQETTVPNGMLINGAVTNTKQFADFLVQIIKKANIKEKHVIVGLPELKATTQSISLPSMSSDETTQAVKNEASSLLPFPLSEAYIDWEYISNPKDNDAVITLSAMPKVVIDDHITALKMAGLVPVSFETTALALQRLIPENASNISLALDYNNGNAVVIITRNKSIKVSSVLQEGDGLIDKLVRLVNYYIKEHSTKEKEETIGEIYLSGKSISKEFVDKVKQQFSKEPVLLSAGIANISKQRQVELAVLSSLARKNAASPTDTSTVNLLPKEMTLELEQEKKNNYEHMGKYAIMFILLGLIGLSIYTLMLLVSKTAMLADQVQELMTKQSNVIGFSPAKVALIDSIMPENEHLTVLITGVLSKQPAGVAVSGISLDTNSDKLLISGRAADRGKLLAYRDMLESLEEISKVDIPLSSLEQELNVEFRMTISL